MPEKPAAERTEQPTPRRLHKAREKGQVPQSQELAAAITLVVLLLALALLAPGLLQWFRLKVESGLSAQSGVFANPQAFVQFFNERIIDATLVILPLLVALMAAGVLGSVAVSGWSFSPQALQLKWSELNPATAMQNALSTRSLVRFLASVAKLCFVSLIV